MAAEDYIDFGEEFVCWRSSWRPPRCNRCGSACHWRDTRKGWRLYSGDKPHVCEVKPEDDFEDLGEINV